MSSQDIMPSVVSLCSGWGGGDEGIRQAGFKKALIAIDNNRHARQSYRLNHEGVDVQNWDVMKLSGDLLLRYLRKEPLDVDLTFATPSCTGISLAGKKDPFNPINLLFLHIIRNIIPSIQSKVFLIETVDNLLHGDMRVLYDIVRRELDKLTAYRWDIRVCNSLLYKTPTLRNRCFILGVHNSLGVEPSWPEPDSEYANNLRILNVAPEIDGLLYGYGFEKLKSKFDFANTFTKTLNLKAAKDSEVIPLTIDQVLKFCGYPPNWKYTGSYEQVWARAGNSVMPPMAYALAKHIKDHILNGNRSELDGITQSPIIINTGGGSAIPTESEPSLANDSAKTYTAQNTSTDKTVYDGGVLYCGDCLDLFKFVEPHSIDMILCNLPYSTTGHQWDKIIPLDELWHHYRRALKPRGVVVLTAAPPFNGKLISSNQKWFRYDMVWKKNNATNFANAKKQFRRQHENILVFYKKAPTFNPQGLIPVTRDEKLSIGHDNDGNSNSNYQMYRPDEPRKYHDGKIPIESNRQEKSDEGYGFEWRGNGSYKPEFTNYPTTILEFSGVAQNERKHPCQKPQPLFEYLIRTYTNKGDIVLDNCVGAGTTAAACIVTGNRFIAMEKEQMYYDISKKTIEAAIRALKEGNTEK